MSRCRGNVAQKAYRSRVYTIRMADRVQNDRKEISYYRVTYPTISRFSDQEIGGLEAYAITCVPPASLTGSCNFDDLPPTEPVISRDWISNLDTRQLGLFKATCSGARFSSEALKRNNDHALLLQEQFLLVRRQNLVGWNQCVMYNVHQ
jgi:hypothetical protein